MKLNVLSAKKKPSIYKGMKVSKENSILTRRGPITKVLFGVVFAIFLLYAISLILPFGFLIINSLKEPSEYINALMNGDVFAMPQNAKFNNYLKVFQEMKIPTYFSQRR